MPSTQTNFPVLVDVTHATLKTTGNGGHVTNSNGYDVQFYSDSAGTTKLDWEVEKYDASAGRIIAWVRIPSCAVGTAFYLFYGNSAITTDQSNKTGVWNSNFIGVWHFGDGTTLSANDSTSFAHNGTIVGSSISAATGKISGGVHNFAAGTDYITIPNPADFPPDSPWTVSGWDFPTVTPSNEVIAGFGEQAGNNGIFFGTDNVTSTAWRVAVPNSYLCDGPGGSLDTTQFQLVVGTFDGTSLRLYKNGSLIGGPTAATPVSPASPSAWIGNWFNGFHPTGTLDEVRFMNLALSADWITSEYNNQSAPGTFLTLGSEIGTQIAVLNIQTRKGLSAVLSFIGLLATQLFHGGTLFNQAFTATVSFVGAIKKRTNKGLLAATFSPTGALVRSISHKITATVSFVGALIKSTIKSTFTATVSFVGALVVVRLLHQAFTATANFSGAISKQTRHLLSAAFSPTGALNRAISFHLSATFSPIGALIKQTRKALTATLSFVGLLATQLFHGGQQFNQAFTATVSFTGSIVKRTSKNLAGATVSFVGSIVIVKLLLKALSATVSFSGALSKRTGKSLTATLSFVSTLSNRIGFHMTATFAPVGALVKMTAHKLTAATLSFIGTLTSVRVLKKALTATLNFSATLAKRTGKTLSASLTFSTAFTKRIRINFTATVSFLTSFALNMGGIALTVIAGAVTKCFALIGIGGGSTTISKTGGTTKIEKTE